MKSLIKIILLTLLLTLSIFAKDVATVTGLNGNADIDRHGRLIKVKLGNKLQEKDIIITNANAKVQVIFEDETIVTVGKNSRFSIDEYLFEDSQEPVARFGMLKGAMRTITGKIGKIAPRKFSVQTKTATIGIRGTNFTILEREDGSQNVFCTYGAISVSVNGVESIVNQGFYADIVQSGAVTVKAFTPKELKAMQKDSFLGASDDSKEQNSDGLESTSKEGQLDTTKDDTPSDLVLKDITTSISDAKQTATPEAGQYHFSDDVSYKISSTLNEFIPEDSWVKASFVNFQGDSDKWTFTMDRTPTSFISNENFSVPFSSATIESTGSSRNPEILSSEFVATGDDLADGDAMSWGRWSASVEYEYDDASARASDMSALWIAGEPTVSNIIDAIVATSIDYDGQYKAIELVGSQAATVTGEASMNVDFGADTATLFIDHNKISEDYSMIISGNELSGANADEGVANGTFYGNTGNLIGGTFADSDGEDATLKGVYQVKTDADLSYVEQNIVEEIIPPEPEIIEPEVTEPEPIEPEIESTINETYPMFIFGKTIINRDEGGAIFADISSPTFFSQELSKVFLPLPSKIADDYLWLQIASTPESYTSKEEFSTYFSGVEAEDGVVSNITMSNAVLSATGDDLADGDYMSWGVWSADISFNDANHEKQTYNVDDALWIAGEQTSVSAVQALNGVSNYSGIYRAIEHNSNYIVDGIASVQVDFGADTANLNIDYQGGRDFAMGISYDDDSVGLAAAVSSPNDPSIANGDFYGPNAESIGGVFSTTVSGSSELSGVYQVTK